MPTIQIKPSYGSQEGWESVGESQPYNVTFFGNFSVDPGRSALVRYSHVDIPAGATITSATFNILHDVKNQNDAQNYTYTLYADYTAASGGVIRQDAIPLEEGVYETTSSSRNWVSIATGTFNWNNAAGHPTYQYNSISITSAIQSALTTNAGRHCSLAFRLAFTAETGDFGTHTNGDKRPSYLEITYTGGTARDEEVVLNDNPNMDLVKTNGLAHHYRNNGFFGTFSNVPTYSTIASDGAITPPFGGKMIKITATEEHRVAVFADPFSSRFLIPGEWYTFSYYVYCPSATTTSEIYLGMSPDVFVDDTGITTLKDQWVRLYAYFLSSYEFGMWCGPGTRETIGIGEYIYVANCNITRGKKLMPYFDGGTTDDATHHRTFEWAGGTAGNRSGGTAYCTMDATPTVTLPDPQTPWTTQKNTPVGWTFNPTYSEAQQRFRVEMRKKRPR